MNIFTKILILTLTLSISYNAQSTACNTQETMLHEHVQLKDLPQEELIFLQKMNKESNSDYFNSKSIMHTIKDLKIFHIEDRDGFLIVRRGVVLVEIGSNHLTVYKKMPQAPSIGTEAVHIKENYIMYRGEELTIEDYGLDGPDVIFNTSNSDLSESFISNIDCMEIFTITSGVSCCLQDKPRTYTGLIFSPDHGWQRADSTSNLHILCNSINTTQ